MARFGSVQVARFTSARWPTSDRNSRPTSAEYADIARYCGYTGLFAEIGRDDGLRISATSRLNLASGRGALNVEASYPLSRLIGPSLNFYIFGQGYVGYGENLLDYNRQATRLRFGLGFVR